MIQQDRIKKEKLLLEAGFYAALGKAITAGNEATKNWNSNDWFPCGAAHVTIKPRNCKFAKWLVREGHGRDSSGNAAVLISTGKFKQAMNPQIQYASAIAKVLREDYNIRAGMWSYID